MGSQTRTFPTNLRSSVLMIDEVYHRLVVEISEEGWILVSFVCLERVVSSKSVMNFSLIRTQLIQFLG